MSVEKKQGEDRGAPAIAELASHAGAGLWGWFGSVRSDVAKSSRKPDRGDVLGLESLFGAVEGHSTWTVTVTRFLRRSGPMVPSGRARPVRGD